MCVIIRMIPNGSITEDNLFNAAANNWHSWGFIAKKKDNKLFVKKVVNPKGSHKDVKRIMDLLKKYSDCERFVHFRHNTRGETSMNNTHPFLAYHSNERDVWFMHNGTFTSIPSDRPSTTFINGKRCYWDSETKQHIEVSSNEEPPESRSDTSIYVDTVLKPILSGWNGPLGTADFSDPNFQTFLFKPSFEKAGGSCRGLLIANDLPSVTIGPWHKFNSNGEKIFTAGYDNVAYEASNDDYFKSVIRGPYKEEMEAKKKAEEELRAKNNPVIVANTSVKRDEAVFQYELFRADSRIFKALEAYFKDYDLASDEDLSRLYYIGADEMEKFITDACENNQVGMIATFIEYLSTRYRDLLIKSNKMQAENATLENRIKSSRVG